MKARGASILLVIAGFVISLAGCGRTERPRDPIKLTNPDERKNLDRISLDAAKPRPKDGGINPGGGGMPGPGPGGPGGGAPPPPGGMPPGKI